MDKKMNRIKAVLAEKGVKQLQLASMLRVDKNTISTWCTNKNQPHLSDLYRIAELLEVNVCELLTERK